ncbi:MAG: hypothetical protein AB1449_11780 [Chloroflexota bacterium]
MEFLGIGPLELIFILVIALIIIGPKDMGKTARTIGGFLNRLYKSEGWHSFLQASRNLRTLPNRLAREAEMEELRRVKQAMTETGKAVARDVRSVEADLAAWTQPAPPTPSPPQTDSTTAPPETDTSQG